MALTTTQGLLCTCGICAYLWDQRDLSIYMHILYRETDSMLYTLYSILYIHQHTLHGGIEGTVFASTAEWALRHFALHGIARL